MAAEIGYTNFLLQYWFVIVILGVGLIAIIIFNLAAYCYFARQHPLDPEKLISELEAEERKKREMKKLEKMPQVTSPQPQKGVTSNGGTKTPDPRALSQLGTDDNSDLQQFRIDALESHNIYRERHGAEPLQYCETLAVYSQHWAEYIARIAKIIHSTPEWRKKYNGEALGENLISTNGFKITGKGLSDMWYSESFKHNFTEEMQQETKSFTQMIWNGSKQVGVCF